MVSYRVVFTVADAAAAAVATVESTKTFHQSGGSNVTAEMKLYEGLGKCIAIY